METCRFKDITKNTQDFLKYLENKKYLKSALKRRYNKYWGVIFRPVTCKIFSKTLKNRQEKLGEYQGGFGREDPA